MPRPRNLEPPHPSLAGPCARPSSVATALVRLAWRFRRRSWYRRPPFLPLPDTTTSVAMYTAYGDSDAVPPMEDVVRYAHWPHVCRDGTPRAGRWSTTSKPRGGGWGSIWVGICTLGQLKRRTSSASGSIADTPGRWRTSRAMRRHDATRDDRPRERRARFVVGLNYGGNSGPGRHRSVMLGADDLPRSRCSTRLRSLHGWIADRVGRPSGRKSRMSTRGPLLERDLARRPDSGGSARI